MSLTGLQHRGQGCPTITGCRHLTNKLVQTVCPLNRSAIFLVSGRLHLLLDQTCFWGWGCSYDNSERAFICNTSNTVWCIKATGLTLHRCGELRCTLNNFRTFSVLMFFCFCPLCVCFCVFLSVCVYCVCACLCIAYLRTCISS